MVRLMTLLAFFWHGTGQVPRRKSSGTGVLVRMIWRCSLSSGNLQNFLVLRITFRFAFMHQWSYSSQIVADTQGRRPCTSTCAAQQRGSVPHQYAPQQTGGRGRQGSLGCGAQPPKARLHGFITQRPGLAVSTCTVQVPHEQHASFGTGPQRE